jgi:phosphoenolpyruvate-protein phosphotransferase
LFSKDKKTLILNGKMLSPGLAEGKTIIHRDILGPTEVSPDIESKHIEREYDRLATATTRITDDLLTLAERIENEMDSKLAAVFEAHQLMLVDASLKEELKKEIRENLVNAGSAVKTVFRRWEQRFISMETEVARHKGDDMRDISIRLVGALSGIHIHALEDIPIGSVLVAKRLLPSDTVFLSRRSAAAVLLEYGGIGSHAALFTRLMGIPCIAGLASILQKIPSGALALVDADLAETIINPQEEQKEVFRQKVDSRRKAYLAARDRAREEAITKDGVHISVLANVGCSEDTKEAMVNGAEGVGLYRIEQAYLGCRKPPDTDELLNEMRRTLEASKGKPVYVRLLDVGADKPLPFLESFMEMNPVLGRRGIRLLRYYPHLLKTQLSAMLKLSLEFDMHILVPMVTLPEDIAEVKRWLGQLGSDLQISSLPKLGAMIETPAAALSAKKLAEYADFLSFGTNDLTQYTFAADRENAAVEQYFNDADDAIFRLLKMVRDDTPDTPLSVCGELAGRPEHVPKLIQYGIKTLSVAPPLIPMIKEAIRGSSCCCP